MAKIEFDGKDSLNTFLNKQNAHPMYYWAVITDNKGKRHISGPYNSEQEATQICVGSTGMADFRVIQAATRDEAKLTQQAKQQDFASKKDILRATERVSHKLY
jgi:hypothetical protein